MWLGIRQVVVFLLLALPAFAWAGDRLVFVSQEPGTPEYNWGESYLRRQTPGLYRTVFRELLPSDASILHVFVSSLSDLPAVLESKLPPGDRVMGVVFLGHGSPSSYSLHAEKSYEGTEIARVLHEALVPLASRPELLVYFASCSGGKLVPGESNLQVDFLTEMQRLNVSSAKWGEVHAIAHQDLSMASRSVLSRKYSRFSHFFFSSGLGALIYRFDMAIFRTLGRQAVNNAAIVRSAPVAIAAGIAAAFGAGLASGTDASMIMQGFMGGAVGTFTLSVSLMSYLDTVRMSWVRIQTASRNGLGAGRTSSIYSAIQETLGSGGRACEGVFL
jgi:hypothetical protein